MYAPLPSPPPSAPLLQGIPWTRLHFSREHYRATRLRQYRNYTNVLPEDGTPEGAAAREKLLASATPTTMVPPTAPFFDFVRNQ